MMVELTRIKSHLVWLATHALDIGAMSVFLYCFREREKILDLYEMLSGQRMMSTHIRVGGLMADLPDGFERRVRDFIDEFPKRVDEYEDLLTHNRLWMQRTVGVGVLKREEAIALGVSGPALRASGVPWDIRKVWPYSGYDRFHFDISLAQNGDVYDRYKVHMDEMRESTRIVRQALDGMPEGPWIVDDRKIVLPPRHELHTSMESLIHHFKLVTEGYRVPEGEVYVAVESARGELGCYVVSDGGPKPWRVKFRAPSFAALEATATCMSDALVADLIAIVGSLDTVMGEVDR